MWELNEAVREFVRNPSLSQSLPRPLPCHSMGDFSVLYLATVSSCWESAHRARETLWLASFGALFLEQSLSARRRSIAWLARLGTLPLVIALPPLQALGMCVVQNPSGHLAGKVHEEGTASGRNAEAGSGPRDILVTWNFLVAGAISKQTVAGSTCLCCVDSRGICLFFL